MNIPIRMAAIDLDGTLLRDDNTVSAYTETILRRVRDAGVRIAIATGRMFCSARRIGRRLGLGDVPMITYSGALIATCETGTILYHRPIDLELARNILSAARELDAFAHAYVHDALWVTERSPRVVEYEKQCRITANVVGEKIWELPFAPTKILINEPDPVRMREYQAALRERFAGRVNFVQSSPLFFEIVAAEVSKGIAVEQLALRYGIDLSEVAAFGNAQNDVDMLRAVGWPVAVANAVPELKRYACLEAPSNDADGVAQILAQYLLEE